MASKDIGRIGEDIAANFLAKKGYTILSRNTRPKRWTEIDIICESIDFEMVFVEVKTFNTGFPTDFEKVVTHRKILAIKRAVRFYLGSMHFTRARVDFIFISLLTKRECMVKHFKNVIDV